MSYIPLLHTAVNAMKVEYIQTLPSFEEDKSRFDSSRHFFKNKITANFRATIENCHHIAAEEKDLDKFAKELLETWKDLVQFVFLPPKDVREAPVPVEVADWVVTDLLERMRGKRQTAYEHFVRTRGLLFQGVVDEVRSTLGGNVPFGKAIKHIAIRRRESSPEGSKHQLKDSSSGTTSSSQTEEEIIRNEVKATLSKKKIPSVFNFSTFASTTPSPEGETHQQQQKPSSRRHQSGRKEQQQQQQQNDEEGRQEKREPKFKEIIRSVREENSRIAQILQAIFSTGTSTTTNDENIVVVNDLSPNNSVVSISLHALYEICKSHDVFIKVRDPTAASPHHSDEKARHNFSRRVFNIVHRGLVNGCHLAVNDTTVFNMLAVAANSQVDPSTTANNNNNNQQRPTLAGAASTATGSVTTANPVTTGPDGAITLAPPKIVTDDKYWDQYFGILIHLLYANFHIKPNKAKNIVPEVPYSGHNICCVAVNKEGKIVGLDFNQCKQDQNLCSHAEKRLSEALNEKLKGTVAPNTPPSLEDYTFISSLEPCHMCANFISRMGVKRIGFLMKDPMQCDALNIAASLLGLTIVRPAGAAFVSEALEETFKNSEFPEEEITSWLGDIGCKTLLGELKEKMPILEGSECDKFMKNCGQRYPGVVVINHNNNNSNNNQQASTANQNDSKKNKNGSSSKSQNDADDEGENLAEFGMVFTTSSILAGMEYGEEEFDVVEEEAEEGSQ